jgi:hypothetical protein
MNKQVNSAELNSAPIDTETKASIDLALGKVERGQKLEAEGRALWVEGTLELVNILHDARERLPADQDFGKWLTDSGFGEDRITRHQRTALLNMALYPDLAREVLEETNRQSWRLIWEKEFEPRLPTAGQPAGDNQSQNNNSSQGNGKPTTRRPRQKRGKQKPDDKRDNTGWLNEQVTSINGVIDELNKQMERCSQEKHDELQTLDLHLLLEASEKLAEKTVEFKDWKEAPFGKAQPQSRSEVTPAPKPKRRDTNNQDQPGA